MAKKKTKKAKESKAACDATKPEEKPEERPEAAPFGEPRWECHTITLTEWGEMPRPKKWLILKSFMLKQQELLGQLQTDFGYWMRAFVDEEKP